MNYLWGGGIISRATQITCSVGTYTTSQGRELGLAWRGRFITDRNGAVAQATTALVSLLHVLSCESLVRNLSRVEPPEPASPTGLNSDDRAGEPPRDGTELHKRRSVRLVNP